MRVGFGLFNRVCACARNGATDGGARGTSVARRARGWKKRKKKAGVLPVPRNRAPEVVWDGRRPRGSTHVCRLVFAFIFSVSASITVVGTRNCRSRSESSSFDALLPEWLPSAGMSSSSSKRLADSTFLGSSSAPPTTGRMCAVRGAPPRSARGRESPMPRVFKPASIDAGVVATAAHAAITPSVPAPSANRPHPPPLEDARMPSSPDARSGALSARLVAESVMMRVPPRASRARACAPDVRSRVSETPLSTRLSSASRVLKIVNRQPRSKMTSLMNITFETKKPTSLDVVLTRRSVASARCGTSSPRWLRFPDRVRR